MLALNLVKLGFENRINYALKGRPIIFAIPHYRLSDGKALQNPLCIEFSNAVDGKSLTQIITTEINENVD